jgi:hypothetical protein
MKKTLLIAAIALVITAGTVSLVDAQIKEKREMNRPELTTEIKVEREAHQAKMQEIMESGTFEEWKEALEERRKITDYITADNFARFQEAHRLKQAGDYKGAQEIMKELGIEGKIGMGRGLSKGIRDCGCQK